eukprot:754321-Hanusia_phi.AAC.4
MEGRPSSQLPLLQLSLAVLVKQMANSSLVSPSCRSQQTLLSPHSLPSPVTGLVTGGYPRLTICELPSCYGPCSSTTEQTPTPFNSMGPPTRLEILVKEWVL